jgi:hypothetical protein
MKHIWLIIGGIVLLALLAGAAFVGGRLLNTQARSQAQGNGPQMTIAEGGKAAQTFKLDIQPAKELPTTPADVRGIFQRRADSSVFIGTGQVRMMVNQNQGGVISATSSFDGPVIEVVVTHDTTIYQDVTMKQFNGPPPAGEKMQQVLESGTIDDIGENSMVVVWGDKRGDRIVARVLTYSPPAFISKPGAVGSGGS